MPRGDAITLSVLLQYAFCAIGSPRTAIAHITRLDGVDFKLGEHDDCCWGLFGLEFEKQREDVRGESVKTGMKRTHTGRVPKYCSPKITGLRLSRATCGQAGRRPPLISYVVYVPVALRCFS